MAKPDFKSARKTNERALMTAVFLEEIDGMNTAEIAEKYGLTTRRVYSLLKPLADEEIKGFTGRPFVMNGEDNDKGRKMSHWFFT